MSRILGLSFYMAPSIALLMLVAPELAPDLEYVTKFLHIVFG